MVKNTISVKKSFKRCNKIKAQSNINLKKKLYGGANDKFVKLSSPPPLSPIIIQKKIKQQAQQDQQSQQDQQRQQGQQSQQRQQSQQGQLARQRQLAQKGQQGQLARQRKLTQQGQQGQLARQGQLTQQDQQYQQYQLTQQGQQGQQGQQDQKILKKTYKQRQYPKEIIKLSSHAIIIYITHIDKDKKQIQGNSVVINWIPEINNYNTTLMESINYYLITNNNCNNITNDKTLGKCLLMQELYNNTHKYNLSVYDITNGVMDSKEISLCKILNLDHKQKAITDFDNMNIYKIIMQNKE